MTIDTVGTHLYVANSMGNSISAFDIDPVTGGLTPIAGSPFARAGGPNSLFAHPSKPILYVSNNDNGTSATYAIDASTGALSEIAQSPVPSTGSGGAGTYNIAIAP